MIPSLKNLIPIFENEESFDTFLRIRRSFTAPSRFDDDNLPAKLKFCILDIPQHRQITASLILIHHSLYKEVEISLNAIENKIADQIDTASSQADKLNYAFKHLMVLHEFYYKVRLLRPGSFRRTEDDMWLKGIFTLIAEADWEFIRILFDEHYMTFSYVDHNTYTNVYLLAIIKRLVKTQDYVIDQVKEHATLKIEGSQDEFGFRNIDFEPEYLAMLLQQPLPVKMIKLHQAVVEGLTENLKTEFTNVTKEELNKILKGSSIQKKAIIKGGPTRFIDVFWIIFEANKKFDSKLIESKKSHVANWLVSNFEYEDDDGHIHPFNEGTINNTLKKSYRVCKNPIMAANNFIENFTLTDS